MHPEMYLISAFSVAESERRGHFATVSRACVIKASNRRRFVQLRSSYRDDSINDVKVRQGHVRNTSFISRVLEP